MPKSQSEWKPSWETPDPRVWVVGDYRQVHRVTGDFRVVRYDPDSRFLPCWEDENGMYMIPPTFWMLIVPRDIPGEGDA